MSKFVCNSNYIKSNLSVKHEQPKKVNSCFYNNNNNTNNNNNNNN